MTVQYTNKRFGEFAGVKARPWHSLRWCSGGVASEMKKHFERLVSEVVYGIGIQIGKGIFRDD
jgi:hypothetical protein